MNKKINVEIDSILRSITSSRDAETRTNKNALSRSKVDINYFFDVLYSLLKSGGYLINDLDKNSPEFTNKNRFFFTEEYPDMIDQDHNRNILTVDIVKRQPASLGSGKDPYQGRVQHRPSLMSQENHDGEILLHMGQQYDNTISITCWSSKSSGARRFASLIEGLMSKYYWAIKQEGFPVFLYLGRGDSSVDMAAGDRRRFGIRLEFFIRTVELFTLRESELKNIKINSITGN